MRRHWRLATAAAVAFACSSGVLAACTAVPATPTPAATATARPTPTPVPGTTLEEGTFTLDVLASRIQFKPLTLEVPAGVPLVIHFANMDAVDLPHDVDIRQLDGITVLRDQEPIGGGNEANYRYEALPRGDYQFICAVHPIPAMTGTLRVR